MDVSNCPHLPFFGARTLFSNLFSMVMTSQMQNIAKVLKLHEVIRNEIQLIIIIFINIRFVFETFKSPVQIGFAVASGLCLSAVVSMFIVGKKKLTQIRTGSYRTSIRTSIRTGSYRTSISLWPFSTAKNIILFLSKSFIPHNN